MEGPMITMCKGLSIDLKENELKLIEEASPATLLLTVLEFQSRYLIISRMVANLLQRELADGDKTKMIEDLATVQKACEKEKSA